MQILVFFLIIIVIFFLMSYDYLALSNELNPVKSRCRLTCFNYNDTKFYTLSHPKLKLHTLRMEHSLLSHKHCELRIISDKIRYILEGNIQTEKKIQPAKTKVTNFIFNFVFYQLSIAWTCSFFMFHIKISIWIFSTGVTENKTKNSFNIIFRHKYSTIVYFFHLHLHFFVLYIFLYLIDLILQIPPKFQWNWFHQLKRFNVTTYQSWTLSSAKQQCCLSVVLSALCGSDFYWFYF